MIIMMSIGNITGKEMGLYIYKKEGLLSRNNLDKSPVRTKLIIM